MHLAWSKKVERICSLVLHIHGPKLLLVFFVGAFFGFENSEETQFFSSWKRFTMMVRMLSDGRFLFWGGWDMLQIPFHEPNSTMTIPLQNFV